MTFAIRNYAADKDNGWQQYHQTGMGSPFMQVTHGDLRNRTPERTGIWLDLVEGNQAAEALYGKNGYRELDRFADPDHDGQRRILMANVTALAGEGLS